MKSKRMLAVLAFGVALLLAGAAVAQHGPGGPGHGSFGFGGGGHMLGFFSDYLDLTTAQQDQIKTIMEKEKPAVQPLMQQMGQYHSQLAQLAQSGTFDEAKVRAIATQQAQTQVELTVQHTRIMSEMVQVLTADQKTKLASLMAKHEKRMQEHMQHMGPPPDAPED
jgi:protein CpxP